MSAFEAEAARVRGVLKAERAELVERLRVVDAKLARLDPSRVRVHRSPGEARNLVIGALTGAEQMSLKAVMDATGLSKSHAHQLLKELARAGVVAVSGSHMVRRYSLGKVSCAAE